MSTGGDQGASEGSQSGSNSDQNRHHGQLRRRDLLIAYLKKSIEKPDNFPNYLIAVFTLGLAIFAYFAWDESTQSRQQLIKQVSLQNESLHIAERATIKIGDWHVTTLDTGRSPVFSFAIKNTGNTLAYVGATSYEFCGHPPRRPQLQ